jgi:RNA polymerase sigma-70 factor (ECF subfamily)
VSYSDLSPPELFSVCAKSGGAESWQEFMRRFNPLIVRSVVRVAMRHGTSEKTLIDDLVQETYLKLCTDNRRILRQFTPQSEESAFGFLKVVATNVAQDFFKSRLAEKRSPETYAETLDEVHVQALPELPNEKLSAADRAVLIGQIDRKLRALVPAEELHRSRVVFWLYYRSGLTASAIASIPSVALTTKGVESLLFRLTRLVRQGIFGIEAPDNPEEKGFRQAESF